jgi:hypothetical protein
VPSEGIGLLEYVVSRWIVEISSGRCWESSRATGFGSGGSVITDLQGVMVLQACAAVKGNCVVSD